MNQDQDIKHREQKPDPFPADTLYELRELLHARNLDMERLKELLHASNKDLERLKEENAALVRQRKLWCMCEAEAHTHIENLVRRLVPGAKLNGDDLVLPMIEELADMLAVEIERERLKHEDTRGLLGDTVRDLFSERQNAKQRNAEIKAKADDLIKLIGQVEASKEVPA